ncbi:hypothetical protein EYF80_046807 [Liparis tanakae]|uniref:Uncharacterized protein n=1 Tax=Liparis tanakae TaxID=230148 RepID=A0A4Z2FQ53_9TELE|nr:hypothetical protein EYF80_046807 [Liparis tanakae]
MSIWAEMVIRVLTRGPAREKTSVQVPGRPCPSVPGPLGTSSPRPPAEKGDGAGEEAAGPTSGTCSPVWSQFKALPSSLWDVPSRGVEGTMTPERYSFTWARDRGTASVLTPFLACPRKTDGRTDTQASRKTHASLFRPCKFEETDVLSSAEWLGEVLEPWGDEVLMGLAEAASLLEQLGEPLKALGHMQVVAHSPHPQNCKPNNQQGSLTILCQASGIKQPSSPPATDALSGLDPSGAVEVTVLLRASSDALRDSQAFSRIREGDGRDFTLLWVSGYARN